MTHLKILHEAFIDQARQPLSFGKLPIIPLPGGAAIIPIDRWETIDSPKRLHKSYKFISNELRNTFIIELLEYETDIGHNAKITIDEYKVTLDVYTKDIGQITELDKEYAIYTDILFKDVVYNAIVKDEL